MSHELFILSNQKKQKIDEKIKFCDSHDLMKKNGNFETMKNMFFTFFIKINIFKQ